MIQPSPRPVFLDLTKIAMPVGALTSIGHRISGIVLTASAPVAVYVLALSLRDANGWAQAAALFAQPVFKAGVVISAWALAHHLLDGVRHLLTDFGIGASLPVARRSAWLVNLGGLVLALAAVAAVL